MNPTASLARLMVFLITLWSGPLWMTEVSAQPAPLAYDEGALGLAFALRKLPVTATFLQITAHPDDEDNPLLVMLSRGRGFQTGLLTLTRGSGGQNEIGPELFEALGILRTEELMSMHRYDQTRQFFARAYDFGYSFSVEETLEKWDKEEMLRDVVRVIRTFRPQIITTLPLTGTGGGQHHQASARIALEAFRAAADKDRFPEQIEQGLYPWLAKKIYQRARRDESGQDAPVVAMQSGLFDPLLGKTYFQVGMEERAYHRCQGMGQLIPLPRENSSRWKLEDSSIEVQAPENDLYDGIDTSLFAIESHADDAEVTVPFLHSALVAIEQHIQDAIAAYHPASPQFTAPYLAQGLQGVQTLKADILASGLDESGKFQILFMLDQKEKDFRQALRLAHQISIEALVDDGTVIPGQEFELVVTVTNGGSDPVSLNAIQVTTPAGWSTRELDTTPDVIPSHQVLHHRFKITVSGKAELTRPYWTRPPSSSRYRLLRPEDAGLPWSPPAVTVELLYRSSGVESSVDGLAQHRYPGPWVGGEQRHELMVVPRVSLRVSPEINVIPVEQARKGHEVRVTALHSGHTAVSGVLRLEPPPGWMVSPEEVQLDFNHEDQSVTKKFLITASESLPEGEFQIQALAQLEGVTYDQGFQVIDYHHVQRRHLYHPSRLTLKTVNVKIEPNLKIGYIMGVGDRIPEALDQLGFDFTFLNDEALAFGELGAYDVIITGVRAYLNREDLKTYNYRLLDWVAEGGTLIVQYNKFEFNDRIEGLDGRRQMTHSLYAPYPVQVGRGRVTDENAPVTVMEPGHPVFLTPNEISGQDWQGWVQERGLYFLGEKATQYRDLLSIEDPFEYNSGAKLGSLVEARHGKGRWIYVGLGLWRELPAGVPGAYRLLANLVSLGRNP
ncbi:MAG: PIG-L family deacetylase [Acidobacteriota bacterium]